MRPSITSGARAGSPRRGYYSYDLKSWHVVVLNSNCGKVGGCDSRSPQGRWLRNDLQNNRSRCTVAYFHHPLQATGTNTPSPRVRPLWSMLQDRDADVIVSGHAHRYERHAPMTPGGERSADGIRQFVVGTGGADGGTEIHGPRPRTCRSWRSARPGSSGSAFAPTRTSGSSSP